MMSDPTDLSKMNEEALRNYEVPFPHSKEELDEIIKAVTERPHGYGTCVYAMSIAATATFNYVARLLGTTGFQSSCADLDILRRTRLIGGPFAIVDANKMLYPQHSIRGDLEEWLEEWRPWAKEQAAKLLAERGDGPVHPNVRAHWEALANGG